MNGDKNNYARQRNEEAAKQRQQQKQKEAMLAGASALGRSVNIITASTNSTPANRKTADAKQAGQTCPNFCRKPGFQVLPLKYGLTQSNTPALNSLLGKNVKNISVSNFKYTAEMVDSGYIYAMVKRGISPEINALSTLLMFATITLVVIAQILQPQHTSDKNSD